MKKENDELEKTKKESKLDKIVLLFCLILVIAFIIVLPNLNSMVRNHNELSSEEEQPETYHCTMTKEEETYIMNQEATYFIEDLKVVEAQIEREYIFTDLDSYNEWKENNGTASNIKGQIEEFSFDEQNLKIIKKIDKNILVIDEDELDFYFPKTYSNLLIYTKDQECDVTYAK